MSGSRVTVPIAWARRGLAKLRGRSADEVRVRAAQAATVVKERCFLALGIEPLGEAAFLRAMPPQLRHADALLDRLRQGANTLPVEGLRQPATTASAIDREATDNVIAEADGILRGEIALFGNRAFDFGNPVNWHTDPRVGVVAPLRHWSRIDYLDPAVAGDKKIPWELNRQQYLLTLARAYAATSDERYAHAFVAHVRDWIAANPPKLGINWASSLEVAYRTIAWVWALMIFRNSDAITPSVCLDMLKQLELNGRHVESNLSTYFSPNTHLTGEALGLYALGTMLPFLPSAARWRRTGRRVLLRQLPIQVRDDGTYFENATYYHRYTLDIYVSFAVLAAGSGEPLDRADLARIELLADALAALVKPDGTHGYFGDDDGGRLLPLDAAAINDFRPALSNAAVLFARPDFKAVAGPLAGETIWLFGAAARDIYDSIAVVPRPARSRALPGGGLFVMRDGGERRANQLVIDCGAHGVLNCGHAHADALGLELVAGGRSLLMDAGTYTYTGDSEARRAFRSTAYHNALTVDGQSSSEPAGPFSWRTIANTRLLHWSTGERFDVLEAEHDGFERLADPVAYRRSLLFVKGGYWILRDRASSRGLHDYAQHFHFAPGATPRLVDAPADDQAPCCRERSPDASGLDIVSFADGGHWELRDGWISTRYSDRQAARTAVFTTRDYAADIVTFLLPCAPGAEAPQVREVAGKGCRAFVISTNRHRDMRDVFAVRLGETIAAEDIQSDAAWLWLRLRGGETDSAVLHGVTRLVHKGRALLRSPRPVDLMLWRTANGVVVHSPGSRDLDVSGLGRALALISGES